MCDKQNMLISSLCLLIDFPLSVNHWGLMHIMLHFAELVFIYYSSCVLGAAKCGCLKCECLRNIFHMDLVMRFNHKHKKRDQVCFHYRIIALQWGQFWKIKQSEKKKTWCRQVQPLLSVIEGGTNTGLERQSILKRTEENMNRRVYTVHKLVFYIMMACTAWACTLVEFVCMRKWCVCACYHAPRKDLILIKTWSLSF